MRNAIIKDILFFGIPGLLIFFFALLICSRDGYDGLVSTLWKLARNPQNLHLLSGWNIVGLLLFIFGLTIAIIALFTLGQSYSSTLVIRKNHQLITHGIYRFTRHPIYFGVLIAVMGAPVYAPSLLGGLTMLLLIPIFLNRIRMEEKMLTDEYGDAYEAYKKTTHKLIPFIY